MGIITDERMEEIKVIIEGTEEYFSSKNYKIFFKQTIKLAQKLMDLENDNDEDDFYDEEDED